MKKYLITFLALALIFPAALIAVQVIASEADDEVSYTESTILGNPREADGIEVSLNLEAMDRLFWDVDLTLGEEIDCDADFDFDYDPPRYVSELKPSFDIGLDVSSFGSSTSGGNLLDGEHYLFGLYDMIADVAERTPDGEEHTETVRLADYYDYYPIYLEIRIGDFHYSPHDTGRYNDVKYSLLIEKMKSYFEKNFQYPIPSSDRHTVTVTKNIAGIVTGVHVNRADDAPFKYLETRSLVSDDAIYFAVVPVSEDGEEMEFEGKHGLYRIPYQIVPYEKPQSAAGYNLGEEYTDIMIDHAELVYPMADGTEVGTLTFSHDGSELYLTVISRGEEQDEVSLTVLDCADMTVKQETPLFTMEKNGNYQLMHTAEDFLVFRITWNTFAVIEKSSGKWQTDFTVTDEMISDYWSDQTYITSAYGYGFDYDGERLAVMGCSNRYAHNGSEHRESSLAAFYVSIYSEKGNLYTGKFTSSLDTGTALVYNDIVKPTDRYTPVIRLP